MCHLPHPAPPAGVALPQAPGSRLPDLFLLSRPVVEAHELSVVPRVVALPSWCGTAVCQHHALLTMAAQHSQDRTSIPLWKTLNVSRAGWGQNLWWHRLLQTGYKRCHEGGFVPHPWDFFVSGAQLCSILIFPPLQGPASHASCPGPPGWLVGFALRAYPWCQLQPCSSPGGQW